jgi:hypothetical protein
VEHVRLNRNDIPFFWQLFPRLISLSIDAPLRLTILMTLLKSPSLISLQQFQCQLYRDQSSMIFVMSALLYTWKRLQQLVMAPEPTYLGGNETNEAEWITNLSPFLPPLLLQSARASKVGIDDGITSISSFATTATTTTSGTRTMSPHVIIYDHDFIEAISLANVNQSMDFVKYWRCSNLRSFHILRELTFWHRPKNLMPSTLNALITFLMACRHKLTSLIIRLPIVLVDEQLPSLTSSSSSSENISTKSIATIPTLPLSLPNIHELFIDHSWISLLASTLMMVHATSIPLQHLLILQIDNVIVDTIPLLTTYSHLFHLSHIGGFRDHDGDAAKLTRGCRRIVSVVLHIKERAVANRRHSYSSRPGYVGDGPSSIKESSSTLLPVTSSTTTTTTTTRSVASPLSPSTTVSQWHEMISSMTCVRSLRLRYTHVWDNMRAYFATVRAPLIWYDNVKPDQRERRW